MSNAPKSVCTDDPFPAGMVEEIGRFLRDVHPKLKPGQDVYPEVFANPLMFPLQRMRETAEMIRTARAINPKVVMEIGADKGGSLYHWCQCLPSVEMVIACEIRGLPYKAEFSAAFPSMGFRWLVRESLPPPSYLNEGSIDVLFIDGDKSLMLADFDAYLPLMNPRGIVFLHDVTDNPGPGDAWREIQRRGYQTRLIHDIGEVEDALDLKENGAELTAHDHWLCHWNGRSCGVGVVYLEGGRK